MRIFVYQFASVEVIFWAIRGFTWDFLHIDLLQNLSISRNRVESICRKFVGKLLISSTGFITAQENS